MDSLLARYPLVVLLVAALVGLEFLWLRLQGKDVYDLRESGTSLLILMGQVVVRGVSALLLTPLFLFVYDHRLFDLGSGPSALAALFLLGEFAYYWFHRASHGVRWLWATHCVHHSSTKLNFSAAYRLGWTPLVSAGWLFFVPLVWLGFAPALVFGMLALNLAYQFFLHTEAIGKLGPLEWVLNTPAHHRVHHAVNEGCIDRNFGGVLIVFDRLFGTFATAPEGQALAYGLGGKPSYNPVRVALGGWASMLDDMWRTGNLKRALAVAFGRP